MNIEQVVFQRRMMKKAVTVWAGRTIFAIMVVCLAAVVSQRSRIDVVSKVLVGGGFFWSFVLYCGWRLHKTVKMYCIVCPVCHSVLSADFEFALLISTKRCNHCGSEIIDDVKP